MSALRAVARAELRTRWRALLALGLVFGLAGGVVLAAAALAVRTATAYPRLVEAVHLDDARVLVPADQPALAAAVPGLPGVERAWVTTGFIAQIDGPAVRYVSLGAGAHPPGDLVEPVVLQGRAPAPDAVDEVLIGEPLAGTGGYAVGDELTLRMLTLDEVARFDVGFGTPDGPVATVRVVGIARMPGWGGALANVLAGPAFAERYAADAVSSPVFVDLRDGTADAFAGAYAAAADAQPPSLVAQYFFPTVDRPRLDVDPAVRTAERVLTGGLSVFALVLAAGGLLVVGQALLRHHGAGHAAQRVESALGLTAAGRAGARVLAAAPAAAVAGLVGGALAFTAGVLPPLGSQAAYEPDPGFRPPWALAAGGAVLLAAVFLLLTALAAVVAGLRVPGVRRVVSRAPRWGGRAPAVVVGLGLALRRGPRELLATIGAAAAVTGVVAAAVFGAGAARLVETPARYGQVADLTVVDARPDDLAALAADPRVAALEVSTGADVEIAGERLEASARERRVGALPVETAQGRPAQAAGEVALGPRFAARLGIAVGDIVTARAPDGTAVPLAVTGLVVVRSENTGGLGEAAQLVPEQLAAVGLNEPLVAGHVLAVPGAAGELYAELSARLEVFEREVPPSVATLADLVALPELLALVLALVGGAGTAQAVLSATRRHTGDLAVLAALGGTPGQLRSTVAVLAAATVLPALLVGVPLGLAVGRVLWAEVALSTGVAGDVAVPVTLLVAIGPVALLGALLAAARPGLRAARTPPAAALSES